MGAAVTIDASFELVPSDSGCEHRITHKPKSRIPLIAKPLEEFLTKQGAEGCEKELDYLVDTLK